MTDERQRKNSDLLRSEEKAFLRQDSFNEVTSTTTQEAVKWLSAIEDFFNQLKETCSTHQEELFVENVFEVMLDEVKYCRALEVAIQHYKVLLSRAKRKKSCKENMGSYKKNKCVHNKNPLKCTGESWEDVYLFEPEDITVIFGNISEIKDLSTKVLHYMLLKVKSCINSGSGNGSAVKPVGVEEVIQVFESVFKKLGKLITPYYKYCKDYYIAKERLTSLYEEEVLGEFLQQLPSPTKEEELSHSIAALTSLEDYSLAHILELPAKKLIQYAEMFDKLVKSSMYYIKERIPQGEESEETQTRMRNMIFSLEYIVQSMKRFSEKAKDSAEYWKKYHETASVYLELQEEDVNPKTHDNRRFISKHAVTVFDKKKNDVNEEDMMLYLFNDFLVLGTETTELAMSEKSLLSKSKTLTRRARERVSSFASAASEKVVSTGFSQMVRRKLSLRSSVKSSTVSNRQSLYASLKNKQKRKSRQSYFDTSSLTRSQSLKEKKNTLIGFTTTVRYQTAFKFPLDDVFIREMNTHALGYPHGFAIWCKVKDPAQASPMAEDTVSLAESITRSPTHPRTDALKRTSQLPPMKSNSITSVNTVESVKSDYTQNTEAAQQFHAPLRLNKRARMKKIASKYNKTGRKTNAYKRHGFEFLFNEEMQCEKLLDVIRGIKTKHENDSGDVDGPSVVQRSKTMKRKWARRKRSTNSDVSTTRTIRSRDSRASSRASQCYRDFKPIYIKNS